MSCNCGPNHGKAFDPECEGPSEADVQRFGDQSDYAEFDDDALYTKPKSPAAQLKSLATVGVTGLVIAAFFVAFVL